MDKMMGENGLIKRVLMLVFGILISSFGMALLIKASLGQSTVSGISYNISLITKMKTGTVVGIINYICFVGQIILLKKEFKPIQAVQLVATTFFSSVLNIYLYNIPFIANITIGNYGLKVVVLLSGIVCMAYGVSLMMVANLTFLPFEGFCKAISTKLNKPFGTVRVYVDVAFVIISLCIISIYKIPNISVREGTIVYTFLFGNLTNIFMKSMKKKVVEG
ncbi:YczE/YyaS/YitT family protein [Clostridium folliculivorans]|uniref:Membrane protein n=1 Tax=Clostridium folliculivorans TaxID=2886038 RepID=A0A9W6DA41_9CLOT|nr:DUF6198 family protein [Clostridium folliculivorans]GKU24437.1 membrane protein [Clostridium folliculivorans]GKU30531.1 membrane protein [Clostridium folliculivorans]